jgi:preprotein translocase subunit SecG
MIDSLVVTNLVDKTFGYISDSQFFDSSGLDGIFIAATIWRGVLFIAIGIMIFLIQNWMTMQKEANAKAIASKKSALNQSNLGLELANARNAYLLAQINPHFMLSSLSYIHDNTRISIPAIAETVRYLSKLLR